MAKNIYETLLILDSNKYAQDPSGVAGALSDMVETIEGTVLASRVWMEQKLAYPIQRQQKGTYWLLYFEADGKRLVELNRAFQLHEGILRTMTLRLDPRLVEPMLANARGEYTPSSDGDEGGDGAAPEGAQEDVEANTEASTV